MLGFFGTIFITKDFSKGIKESQEKFYLFPPKGIFAFRIVLEHTKKGDFKSEGKVLADFKLEDNSIMLPIIDKIQGIEIEITGKQQKFHFTDEDIILENQLPYIEISDRGDLQLIRIDAFELTPGKYQVKIKAPNLSFTDWTARFVLGIGASGSEIFF